MTPSWIEYKAGLALAKADADFYGLIVAAILRADSNNAAKIRAAWPDVYDVTEQRYHGPGGYISTDSDDLIRNTAGDAAEAIIERLARRG